MWFGEPHILLLRPRVSAKGIRGWRAGAPARVGINRSAIDSNPRSVHDAGVNSRTSYFWHILVDFGIICVNLCVRFIYYLIDDILS